MGGECSAYDERRGVYRILVGKPEGKRPLWRPRLGWEDNIDMEIQEVECSLWTVASWLRMEVGGGQL